VGYETCPELAVFHGTGDYLCVCVEFSRKGSTGIKARACDRCGDTLKNQIPPDLLVKTQAIDIVEVILELLR
jgi:hypothetical protein